MESGGSQPDKSIALYNAEPSRLPVPPFRDQTRLTVTVKMLKDATIQPTDQGRLVINHSQVHAVQLCGLLISIEHGDIWTYYILNDGTGSIAGRIWLRDPEGWTDLSTATLGKYYIINGTLATRYDELKIDSITAREVADPNEITVHYLTVIHEHLSLNERYSRVQVPSVTFAKAHIEIDREAILAILSDDSIRNTDEGASEHHLKDALNLEGDALREALDALLNDGEVYNTIDDKHYKRADN